MKNYLNMHELYYEHPHYQVGDSSGGHVLQNMKHWR